MKTMCRCCFAHAIHRHIHQAWTVGNHWNWIFTFESELFEKNVLFFSFHCFPPRSLLYVFSLLFNFSNSQMISFGIRFGIFRERKWEENSAAESERGRERESENSAHERRTTVHSNVYVFFILHRLMSSIRFIFHSHITHVEMNNNRGENVQLFEIQQLKSHGLSEMFFQWGRASCHRHDTDEIDIEFSTLVWITKALCRTLHQTPHQWTFRFSHKVLEWNKNFIVFWWASIILDFYRVLSYIITELEWQKLLLLWKMRM